MRKFSSYGPVDKDLHFYVPREELIQKAFRQLMGENPDKGGHYLRYGHQGSGEKLGY